MNDDLSPEELEALSKAMAKEPVSGVHSQSISKAQFLQLEEIAKQQDIKLKDLEKLYDLQVRVEVVLGRTKKKLEEILHFTQGSVVELEQFAGEPVDVTVNGRVIARGEVVVIDEHFGVKILEIANAGDKIGAARKR